MSDSYSAKLQAFENCEIDAGAFSHGDHVGVAYEMLRQRDFLDAAAIYSNCIRTMANKVGADGLFNVTITLAFLSIIAERMTVRKYEDYIDFISENPDLLSKSVLKRWYSDQRLLSDRARRTFLLPDQAERVT